VNGLTSPRTIERMRSLAVTVILPILIPLASSSGTRGSEDPLK